MDPPTPWHALNILNAACHVHRARPGGIPTSSVIVIDGTPYAVAEMPPDLAACIRVARAIYGPDVRVFMLITQENVEEARS